MGMDFSKTLIQFQLEEVQKKAEYKVAISINVMGKGELVLDIQNYQFSFKNAETSENCTDSFPGNKFVKKTTLELCSILKCV